MRRLTRTHTAGREDTLKGVMSPQDSLDGRAALQLRCFTHLLGEGVPRLSESALLLAQFLGSSHSCQQRHDGTPLLTEGHQEGMNHLRDGKHATY